MKKLIDILFEVRVSTSLIEKFYKECMVKYFGEYVGYLQDWGIPDFKTRILHKEAGYLQMKELLTRPLRS